MNISKPQVSPLSGGRGPAQPQPVKGGQPETETPREETRQAEERDSDAVRRLSREEGERIPADRDPDDPVSP